MRLMVKVGLAVVLGVLVLSWAGCSSARRFDPTPEGEFEQAYFYYDKGDYTKSIDYFKQLIYKYPGSELVEQARYYLADSYFQNEDYILAANEFEQLNREFPQGQFADVALFKAGLSYSAMSRRPERDQTETKKAMETLQTLLTKYPNTEYADTVRKSVDLMKNKLAEKEYRTALFYYEREIYESAIIYLKSVINNYPESTIMPQTLYRLCKASKYMGYPDDAEDAKAWLCKDFPGTDEARELCGESEEVEKQDSLTGNPSNDGGTQ